MRPEISIIMPSYNHGKYIGYAIESVIKQSFHNWELIIIDDGSVDNSREIILGYAKNDHRIRFYEQKNKGVSATTNKGIRLAKGEYIAFLDSDDAYKSNKLNQQITILKNGYDFVFSKVLTIDGDNNEVNDSSINHWFNDFREQDVFNEDAAINILERNYICKGSVILKKDIFQKFGYFDERLITAYDFHYWHKIIGKVRVKRCNNQLFLYRWHGENETIKNNQRIKLETLLIYDDYLASRLPKNQEFYKKRKKRFVNLFTQHLRENGIFEQFSMFQAYKKASNSSDSLDYATDEFLLDSLKVSKENIAPMACSVSDSHSDKINKNFYYYIKTSCTIVKDRGFVELAKKIYGLKFKAKVDIRKNDAKNKAVALHRKLKIQKELFVRIKAGKNKNILFLIPWMTVGGADKVNLDLAKYLNSEKHTLHFLTTVKSKNEWAGRFKKITKNVFHLEDFVLTEDAWLLIKEYVKIAKIDTIVISNSATGYDCLEKIKNQFPHLKVYDILHGQGGVKENGGFPAYSAKFDHLIDARIVISGYLKKYLINQYAIKPKKIIVIRNGIDTQYFDHGNYDIGLYRHRFCKKSDFVVSFIGRLSPEKHPEHVVAIAHEIVNKRMDKRFRFIIAGDGDLFAPLKSRVDDLQLNKHVIFLGAIENVPQLMRDSDVVLLTSEMEGIPIVLLEALSMQVPAIATNVGGVSEIITDGKEGFLIDYNKDLVGAFADKIQFLADNRNIYKKMQNNTRKKIVQDFNIERSARQFEKIL